jgi:nickel superoxide dismutase
VPLSEEDDMKSISVFFAVVSIISISAPKLMAHCEVPCGIYGDEIRIALIREHIDTVERSMKMIKSLTNKKQICKMEDGPDMNFNQIVRWVNNKEKHAEEIQHIVHQYFMTQRIKPVDDANAGYDAYIEKLTLLHRLLVEAMKSKQVLDPKHVVSMRELVDKFEELYFEKD